MSEDLVYLSDAIDHINRAKIGSIKEIRCPCCGQNCKLYKRRLHSILAKFLILLVKIWEEQKGWVNVREDPRFKPLTRNGDYAVLRHWNLAIQCNNAHKKDTKHSGLWMPSQAGVDFVYKRILVPSHVHMFTNQLQGWSNKMVGIEEALGTKFSYDELMSGKGL